MLIIQFVDGEAAGMFQEPWTSFPVKLRIITKASLRSEKESLPHIWVLNWKLFLRFQDQSHAGRQQSLTDWSSLDGVLQTRTVTYSHHRRQKYIRTVLWWVRRTLTKAMGEVRVSCAAVCIAGHSSDVTSACLSPDKLYNWFSLS